MGDEIGYSLVSVVRKGLLSEEVAFETQMTLVETWERDIPGAEEALNWYAELPLLLIIS